MDDPILKLWVWTLGIGLPVFLIVAIVLWRRAQRSVWWRLSVCLVLACAIAPSLHPWTNGHSDGGVILMPAVLFAAGVIDPGSERVLIPLILGVLPLGVVSFVVFGIWSLVIRKRKREAESGATIAK
jgi:hypothetical protein